MKKLVIVESPSKEKSVKKYLGSDYEVKASRGHIVDLPKKDLGVDPEKGFEPKYVVMKKKVLTGLKKAFEGKDTLVLAVDPDREGEAIGWHVAQKLGVINKAGKPKTGKKIERIVFDQITKDALQKAVKQPREIDMNLVNAQQTRRILDRLVGYKLSPLLWKKISFGLSAGRVQSVTVKLIVDRERERDKFKAEEFWNVDAFLQKESIKGSPEVKFVKNEEELIQEQPDGIKFSLVKVENSKVALEKEQDAAAVISDLEHAQWKINNIDFSIASRQPSPPFKTSTLQQAAATRLGFSSKRTMRAAQKLYESGLITYMRTDSLNMATEAVNAARQFIQKRYGDHYVVEKPRYFKTKSKVAQEAHEAIRPTDFNVLPADIKLGADEAKVYRLIWQKALATQATAAKVETITAVIIVGKYIFEAKGQHVVFDGYLKISEEKTKELDLPDLTEGEVLFLKNLIATQKFTQPPSRYSEATLIKALEKEDIGRPSTYSAIISTILDRKYVVKEGKFFVPTDIGAAVTHLLEDHFPEVVDVKFTAKMENDLDEIANGVKKWKDFLSEFYTPFEKSLKSKEKNIERKDYKEIGKAPEDVKCPNCGGGMVIKLGRYGRFYSCSKWPDCKGMLSVTLEDAEGLERKAKSDDFLSKYKPAPKTDDGRDYLLKVGRFGQFWAHPDYPKIKDAKALEYNDVLFKQLFGNPPKATDGTKMQLRNGKFGPYWAHSNYPKVKEVNRIDQKALKLKKKELGVD